MKSRIVKHCLAVALASIIIAATFPFSVHAELPLCSNPLPEMLKKVVPGVVNISTRTRIRYEENPLFNDPFFRQFFNVPNRPLESEQQSLGSGVVIDASNGYAITNPEVFFIFG